MNKIAGFIFMALSIGLSAQADVQTTTIGQEIIIGIVAVESGDPLREIDYAARLAVTEINAEGGISLPNSDMVGSHFVPSVSADGFDARLEEFTLVTEIIIFSTSAGSVDAAGDRRRLEKFIRQKGPTALIVGSLSDEQSLMVATICAEWEIPLLFTAIADSGLEESLRKRPAVGKFAFHTAPSTDYVADFLGSAATYWDAPNDVKRLYVLSDRIPWAREVAVRIINRAGKSSGLEVIGHQDQPMDALVLNGIDMLLIIGESKLPDLLQAEPGPGSSSSTIVLVNPRLPFGEPQKSGKVAQQKQGWIVFALGNVPSSNYPPSVRFHTDYRNTYGENIRSSHIPAAIYDAVHLLKEALVVANSTIANDVIAAMERADRIGVMGRLRFDEHHHLVFGLDPTKAATSLLVVRSPAGRLRIVYPPGLAD